MARIGYTACGLCGNTEATVSETATGTLSTNCHKCEFSGYAKKGSKAARLIRAALVVDADDKPAAEPVAKPSDDTPAIKAGFSMASL